MRQRRKAAVAGIDMHPEIESPRHLTHLRERIECAVTTVPAFATTQNGRCPGFHVFRDLGDQIADADLEALIYANRAHVVASKTQEERGF